LSLPRRVTCQPAVTPDGLLKVLEITPSSSAITGVPFGIRMSSALSDCQLPRVWVPWNGVPMIGPCAPSG
jgi:hypothetical protein